MEIVMMKKILLGTLASLLAIGAGISSAGNDNWTPSDCFAAGELSMADCLNAVMNGDPGNVVKKAKRKVKKKAKRKSKKKAKRKTKRKAKKK